jgi:hypothetical protein
LLLLTNIYLLAQLLCVNVFIYNYAKSFDKHSTRGGYNFELI